MRSPGITLAFALVGASSTAQLVTGDLRFAGRHLTNWLEMVSAPDSSLNDRRRAKAAIEAIGTNGIPHYLSLLQSTGTNAASRHIDSELASAGFRLLGAKASGGVAR